MAFTTNIGHYELPRMLFCYNPAPVTFERINKIFGGIRKDPESHLVTLKPVLGRLQMTLLKVKLSKCEFFKSNLKFWVHVADRYDKTLAEAKYSATQFENNSGMGFKTVPLYNTRSSHYRLHSSCSYN